MLNMPMDGAPKGGTEWGSPSSSMSSDSWSEPSEEEEEDDSGFTGLNSRSVQEPKLRLIPRPGSRDWDRRSPLHSVYKKPSSMTDFQHASHPIAGHENRPYSRDSKEIRGNKGTGSIRDVKAKPGEEEWPKERKKDEKDHVDREGWTGGEKDIVDKITQQKCIALEQKKPSASGRNMESEAKGRKRERDGDLVGVMPVKRSWGYDKESDEDDADEDGTNKERDAFSYGVQKRKRTLCPRGNPQDANRYGRLKSCGQDGEGSQADECMQELTRLRKEYRSSQANKNSDSLFDSPALEIRIPAEHVTATNCQHPRVDAKKVLLNRDRPQFDDSSLRHPHSRVVSSSARKEKPVQDVRRHFPVHDKDFQCDLEDDFNDTSFVGEEHSQDDIDSFFHPC